MLLIILISLFNWDKKNIRIDSSYFVTVPPRWILEPTDKAFAQGSDARVECKADGFPKPQVTWKKAAGKCSIDK